MKVLVVNVSMKPGGAERQLINIITELVRKGIVVSVILFQKEGRYLDKLKDLGVEVCVFPEKTCKGQRLLDVIRKSRWLIKKVKKDGITTLVSFLPACNILCELVKLRLKKKINVLTGARSLDSVFIGNASYKLHYFFYSLSDYVISNSFLTKKEILSVNRIINPDKIKVIYNYLIVDNSYLGTNPNLSDRRRIIVAANYGEIKNIINVIEAFNLLDEHYRKMLDLKWYGVIHKDLESNTYPRAKKMVEEYNLKECITLCDSTSDIYSVMQESDIVALFSKAEGFPNSIAEGMLIGRPVITTPVSDLPELLKNTDNIICKDYQAVSIKEALITLCEMDRERLISCGENNSKIAKDLFGIANINQIIELIK